MRSLLLYKTAAILVAVVCFYGVSLLLVRGISEYENSLINGDPVSILEQRVLRVRPFVFDSADVGYLAELDYNGARAREFRRQDVEHIGCYYLTQYALAPTRVFHSTAYPKVVAHFLKDTDAKTRERLAETRGLALVEDVGEGVALYRR